MWAQDTERIPAHVRNLETGPGRKRENVGRDPADSCVLAILERAPAEQLHPEADSEQGPAPFEASST
jgi:hypothetical protein